MFKRMIAVAALTYLASAPAMAGVLRPTATVPQGLRIGHFQKLGGLPELSTLSNLRGSVSLRGLPAFVLDSVPVVNKLKLSSLKR